MDTLTLLQQVLSERAGTTPDKVTPDASLESLDIDSLMLLDLMFEFEEKLGVTMPKDIPRPNTVGELVALFDSLRAGAKQ